MYKNNEILDNYSIGNDKQDYDKKNRASLMLKKLILVLEAILSFLHFIPTFFLISIFALIGLLSLIFGTGGSKFTDTSSLGNIFWGSFGVSIFLILVSICLFILTMIVLISFFRKKYLKTLDIFVSASYILLDVFYLIFLNSFGYLILITSIITFSSNLIYTFIKKKGLF